MKKLKVLIVHNYYQIPGGEDAVVENESNLLKENGHEVILYTRHNDEIKKRGILGKVLLLFETIFSFRTYREVKKLIKKNNIDIVHVHNTFPLVSPSAYYAAFNCKVTVVQTVHNFRLLCPGATLTKEGKICEECIYKGFKSALKHKCYRNSFLQTCVICIMLKFHRILGTYKRVDGYIALTEFNKNKLLNLITDERKIFVKPNFVKKSQTMTLPRQMDNYFVFIGRLDKLKGINLLVEAWKNINQARLLIIGYGPEWNNVQKFIEENKLNNVSLLGFMPREKAFEIIKKSRAIIMPSQCYEGFPMAIVESFLFGVPVIAGNIGNLASIINDRENGLHFKYNDKEDLINKILQLMEDADLNNKLNEGALNAYNSMYTEKINYELLIRIYNNVIGGKVEEV